jgi:hypothetical protein
MSILKFILIGLLAFTQQKEEWVKIRGDYQISFLFPSRGERVKKDVNNIRSWIFQTKNVTCVFGVVCTQLTKEKGTLDAYTLNQLYIAMRKESVSMPTAKLVSEMRLPSKNAEIWEICYTVKKDLEEMTYFKRFIFRDNCMYQVSIGAKTKDLKEMEPQKTKFFNSITFLDSSEK